MNENMTSSCIKRPSLFPFHAVPSSGKLKGVLTLKYFNIV